MLTPEERAIRARAAAFAQKAMYDSRDLTEKARAVARTNLDRRLCEKYGIDLANDDGPRRLEAARKAHFTTLAFKAAKTRRLKRERAR